jgi:hypothetical protein
VCLNVGEVRFKCISISQYLTCSKLIRRKEMSKLSCGLEDYELDILDTLFSRHCFNSNSSFNLKRNYKGYQRRFKKDVVEVAKELSNKGYITRKTKSDPKYYISNREKTREALLLHNHSVVLGRIRPL